jgi:hypothetical protein
MHCGVGGRAQTVPRRRSGDKILNLTNEQPTQIDFKQAKSMTDIGRKLLQSVGFHEPDDASIKAAIEANDAFIDRLTAIRDAAQTLAVERDE